MMWWVICGEDSHVDRHAGREIQVVLGLGIVRRIRPWCNPRRRDHGELQLRGGGLQMVGDVMQRETVVCGLGIATESVRNA
jgi:hypothetical protein